jgi:hypothetical protein
MLNLTLQQSPHSDTKQGEYTTLCLYSDSFGTIKRSNCNVFPTNSMNLILQIQDRWNHRNASDDATVRV